MLFIGVSDPRGYSTIPFLKLECAHALKGLAMPSGEIAVLGFTSPARGGASPFRASSAAVTEIRIGRIVSPIFLIIALC